MKSNYKKLGKFIEQVDERNKDLLIKKLLGVSNEKYFMTSIANIIGTDLTNYKIVRTGQFAFGNVTSRNGDKLSIALLKEDDCIVSSSYTVFKIKDKNELDANYLLMWFKRKESDRYIRFMSHGSVRELFDWNKLCEIELPVPEIAEQRRIVDEFNVIQNRIKLKQEINNNLFEQAKTIFIKNYSSKDFYEENSISLKSFCTRICSGGTPSRDINEYWEKGSNYWLKNGEIKNNIILSTEEKISDIGLANSSAKLINSYSVSMAMYCVSEIQVSMNVEPLCSNQAVLNFETDSFNKSCFVYYLLSSFGNELTKKANGSAQQNLSKDTIEQYVFLKPHNSSSLLDYLTTNMNERIAIAKEIKALTTLSEVLISKIAIR